MERHSFRRISGYSPKTMRTLCPSLKFLHQEIKWNYGILRSVETSLKKSGNWIIICFNMIPKDILEKNDVILRDATNS